MRPTVNFKRLLVVSLIVNLALLLAVLVLWGKGPTIITRLKSVVVERTIEDIPLTDSAITHELTQLGCVLPNVALAQIKIETGHYKSAICRENKNLAGIKTSRSDYVAGMNLDHCVYKTYRDCLRDYVRIQDRYLKNIDGKYATSETYIEQLKQVK